MVAFVIAQLLSYVCPNVFAVIEHDGSVLDPVDDFLVIAVNISE
jgi:hypothetical protein